jgi:hypothetical protein
MIPIIFKVVTNTKKYRQLSDHLLRPGSDKKKGPDPTRSGSRTATLLDWQYQFLLKTLFYILSSTSPEP